MKKILSLILVVVLVFSLVACGNNENNDSTANTNEVVENTQSTENTEITDDGEDETIGNTEVITPENTTEEEIKNETTDEKEDSVKPTETEKPTETTKPEESTKPTETEKPVETTKPHSHNYSSKVTKKATCTTNGIRTFTCSCGGSYTETIEATGHSWGTWYTTKEPTTSTEGSAQRKCNNCGATENKSIDKIASSNKSYYVGLELVSIEHKTTKYDIDGMNFFDKIYGKNNGGQVGDVVTYKIKTSDGNPVSIRVNETQNCTYTIDGNTLKMTFTDARAWENWAYLSFYAKDESGTEKKVTTKTFTVVTDNQEITSTVLVNDAIKHYASRMGLQLLTGEQAREEGFATLTKDYVAIPNNTNWLRDVIHIMDTWKTKGYTKYVFQIVWQDGWQGTAK